MTVFSIVFVHRDDKRIFLWMAVASDEMDAMQKSQKELEAIGVDYTRLVLVIIRGMVVKELNIGKQEDNGESELAGFEAFRKDHGLEPIKKKTRKKKV